MTAISTTTSYQSVLSEILFTEGVHYFEFSIEESCNDELSIGITEDKYGKFDNYFDSNAVSYVFKANGNIMDKDNIQYKFQPYALGDKIGFLVNLTENNITFYRNGEKDPHIPLTIHLVSFRVLATLNGQSRIHISSDIELLNEVEDLISQTHPSPINNRLAEKLHNKESLAEITPSDITVLILDKLATLNEPILKNLLSGKRLLSRKAGISFDLQLKTIELLDRVINYSLEIAKSGNFDNISQDNIVSTLDATYKLLKAHLLATTWVEEIKLSAELRKSIIDMATECLTILQGTNAAEQAKLLLSSCFSVFYKDPQDKLSYLVDRLEDKQNGKKSSGIFKDLEDKIFTEMASPANLYPALELINEDYHTTIVKYLSLVADRAVKVSIKIIDGKESSTGIIQLLEISQLVLISQAAKANYQGKWQDILVNYSIKIIQSSDDILRHITEKHKIGLVDNDLIERINKTILKNLLEGLIYSLMLSKLSLDFLSKILPLLQNLIASLAVFLSSPPKLTAGAGIRTEWYESSHNYDNSMDVTHLVKIPQARKYTLLFDTQCKTENGCDYLELWTDDTKTNKIARWEGENFPKEAFEVVQPQLFFTFHSDGSVNYYGWKIEIKAVVESSYYKKLWPETTKEACGMVLGLISTKMIVGDFELTPEDENASKLLNNPLLMYGIKDKALIIAKEPSKISENLMTLSTTPGIGEKLKKAMLVRSYSEDVSRRVVRSQQVAKTLDDYVSDYGFWDPAVYSEVPFLQELIEGSDWVINAWNDIRKRSGASGPAFNIGGGEMDQAERAVFAVYTAFFEMSDTIHKLFQTPSDIGATLKHIVKQTNLIRNWAQKQKQKLIDEGNPDITYTEIGQDIVKKCTILLGSEFKLSLNELGVNKVMRNLLSSVVKAQTKEEVKTKEGSRWNKIRDAVGTASTLKNLLHLNDKKANSESDDMKEFSKVKDLVNSFLESPCSVEKVVELLDQRRTRAIARTLGYLCLANLVNISPKQETNLVRAFGDSLRSKGLKKHYWHGLEGADPELMLIVQKSFYQIFGLLQKELIRSRQRPLTIAAYNHYLSVLEAMSSPLKGVDAYMILELQLTSTVNILLSWAKGHIGEEVITREFQINKCITRLGVFESGDLPMGSSKLLINKSEDGVESYLLLDRGGDNALPISELIVSDAVLEDYEDAVGPVVINGETKYINIRREDPRIGGRYLTDIVDLKTPVFAPWEEIAAEEPAEEKKTRENLKERLSKSAWSLFKLLMYSIVGSMVDYNESKKILVQELFIRVLFVELRWDDSLHQPDTSDFKISNLSSGSPWLGKVLVPKSYQKNPMVEWIRQFKQEIEVHEDFVIKDVINEFVEKADPAMKGILTHNDLAYIDESIVATLQAFDDNKNYKGEFDFFRYLRVLRNLAGDFPLQVQEYIETSKLWQTLPEDFYSASRDYDVSNISRIQEIIASRLIRNDEQSFAKILERISQSETPGIVDKSQIDETIPAEFKNSSGNLDLYVVLHAISRNQAKFEGYYSELVEIYKIYDDLPSSCEEILKEKKEQSNYIGSLLWTLYGCFGSNCINSVLAREDYIEELLKLTFLSSSENTILPGARILAKVIPSQHSPESFSKVWQNLSKYLPHSERKLDFVTLLLNKVGKAAYWYNQKENTKVLNRWGYEIESLLLALTEVERWKKVVIDTICDSLVRASSLLANSQQLDLHHIGVLHFLANTSKNFDQMSTIPLELSRVRLVSSNYANGTIKSIDGHSINAYSVVEDTDITEPESKIEAVEPYIQTKIYSVLTLDEKTRLAGSVIKF